MKKQTIDDFTNWFCREFEVQKSTLSTRSRQQGVAYVRYCYCALARSQGFKLHEIGSATNRSHATVLSSIERHLELISDKKYRKIIGKKVMV